MFHGISGLVEQEGDCFVLVLDLPPGFWKVVERFNKTTPADLPLLRHEKALVISTTLFKEESYKTGWELMYPGIKNIEHVYFTGVPVVHDETRQGYLERAYKLGKEFTSKWSEQ